MAAGGKDEFELQRRRVETRSQVAEKEAQQNIKRQFARLGALQSGAFIKQQALERQRQQEARQGALTDINISQAQTLRAEREAEAARQFAGRQAQLGREYQTSERLGTQEYQTGERRGIQQYQTGERLGAEDYGSRQLQREIASREKISTAGIASQEKMQRLGIKSALELQQDAQRWQTAERIGGQVYSAQEREAQNDFLYKSQSFKQAHDNYMASVQNAFDAGEAEKARRDAAYQSQLVRDMTVEQARLDRLLTSRNLDEQVKGRQDALAFEKYKLNLEQAITDRNDRVNTINALRTQGYQDTQIQAVLEDLGFEGDFATAVLGADYENKVDQLTKDYNALKTRLEKEGRIQGGGDSASPGGSGGGGSMGGF